MDRGLSKDVFRRTSHDLLSVLVSESSHVVTNVGSAELLLQRHLLELHAVHASIGSTQQGGCDNKTRLHDANQWIMKKEIERWNCLLMRMMKRKSRQIEELGGSLQRR